MSLLEQHNFDVKNVQAQMKDFFERKQKVKIYHGSTNSTRAQKFEKNKYVDVSSLGRVIEINTNENYILVEPNVPMDKLVDETLRYNLVPPVVMEFPGITVGGGIQGGAGESSSFKYGLFHKACLEYEIILGNGDLVTASPTQNQDLFYGTVCSYGTLGIITLVKMQLIPAKKFVHLKYQKTSSFEETTALIEEKCNESFDFVDGIIFEKNRGTVMTGLLSDEKKLPKSTFCNRKDEWFYIHTDKISKKHNTYEEIIPIKDYLFRYDRGGFWGGRYASSYFHIPFIWLTRFIFNKIFKTRMLYRVMHMANISQKYFVQDLSIPKENTLKFLQFVDKELHIYPLWLCPLKPEKNSSFSPNFIETDLVINVGVWGIVGHKYEDFIFANRNTEKIVRELGGRKVLYAHSYYTKEEFWEIYDSTKYDQLREKYFATSVFSNIYENIKVSGKYKPSFWGNIKALIHKKLPVS